MAQVTSPLLLDGTGQIMLTKLEGIRAALAAEVTPATTSTPGIVKPDGTTITVDSNGTISAAVAPATTSVAGTVKPDGTTITVTSDGTISADVAFATTAKAGTVKPDGTSITVSNDGTISAQAGEMVFQSHTIDASGWSNNVYSFELEYPSASYDILDITPSESASDAQRKAWISADCGGFRATNTIYAHGTVPTVDIPAVLLVRSK